MKELGGYIELDTYNLPNLHEKALALNCGRNALAYILRARNINKIWIPRFICRSVIDVCKREKVECKLYSIGVDFLPKEGIELGENEWLLVVNYYSQLDNKDILKLQGQYDRIIVDNAQSYFQLPVDGIDTIYNCRKYFGVADGAFLYTDSLLDARLPQDESYDRMSFILGRYERTASEFYDAYQKNNRLFRTEPIKTMSKLTNNMLHAIDWNAVKSKRIENFKYLNDKLCRFNQLDIKPGTFMYPLMVSEGSRIRKQLQQKKIYIPVLWPEVLEACDKDDLEYRMADTILPLPIDQRYGRYEMDCIVREVLCCTNSIDKESFSNHG